MQCPTFVFNWVQRGSPFYPFRIAGFLSFNHQLSETLAKFSPADPWRQGLRALGTLFVEPPGSGSFLNLGWSAAILLGVGLVGARRICRMPGGAVYLCWCTAGVAITAPGSCSALAINPC